jgi:hypothetical protein
MLKRICSLKFNLGPPYPTLLCPAGGLPLKWPYGHFRGGLQPSSTPLDTPRHTHMFKGQLCFHILKRIGVWQGVAMESQKFHFRRASELQP